MHLPSSCCPWRSNTPSASLAPSYSGSLKSNTSFGLGPSSSYAGKLRSPHVNAVNIKKMKEKWVRMSTLPLLLWSSSIGSLRLKNEPSSSSSIRTFKSKPRRTWLDEQAMAGWTSKWREEAKPWLDEQASEEQARQGSSTGVLMQQAGEPSDQLAVSARQTNENVAPKRAQAKQTSERKNSTSERNIRTATRHRQKFVRHRVHRHA